MTFRFLRCHHRDHGLMAAMLIGLICLLASDLRMTTTSKSWVFEATTDATTQSRMENCSSTLPVNNNKKRHNRNNQTYTWYGNQWIPPPGVPIYTKDDMKRVFLQFDTLWIGDSTTRRAYATMFALINASKSIVSVKELNHAKVIDINKRAHKGIIDEDSCQRQRDYAKSYIQEPGMTDLWTTASICRQIHDDKNKQRPPSSFDYVRLDCYKNISQIPQYYWEMQRYSLIILGVGVHNVLAPHLCSIPKEMSPMESKQQQLQQWSTTMTLKSRYVPVEYLLIQHGLEGARNIASALHQAHENQTRPTAVLWRTSGFDTRTSHVTMDIIDNLNKLSADFILRNSTMDHGNLALVDWGSAIRPRSLPPERIEGDIGAHYGLEARLLMAQMTTQQLINMLE